MIRTAVEVRRNDPGKAEDYEIPKSATAAAAKQPAGMPDMKQIQEMLKNMQVPSQRRNGQTRDHQLSSVFKAGHNSANVGLVA
jgi:hypothetical protein